MKTRKNQPPKTTPQEKNGSLVSNVFYAKIPPKGPPPRKTVGRPPRSPFPALECPKSLWGKKNWASYDPVISFKNKNIDAKKRPRKTSGLRAPMGGKKIVPGLKLAQNAKSIAAPLNASPAARGNFNPGEIPPSNMIRMAKPKPPCPPPWPRVPPPWKIFPRC